MRQVLCTPVRLALAVTVALALGTLNRVAHAGEEVVSWGGMEMAIPDMVPSLVSLAIGDSCTLGLDFPRFSRRLLGYNCT